jgi:LCP family protein required for cell wall assembly
MVDIPSCRREDGTRGDPVFAMFNHAFEVGGSACTIRTVEKLTGIRVDHHMVLDFAGFKEMVDAVDGVEVCLSEPVDDKAAKLRLPAGRVTLDGEQALGYVRARKSLGNGSDTDRMERRQGAR